MNPLLDQLLTGALILGALAYFGRRFFGRKKKGCDAGCGCDSIKKPFPPPPGV